VKPAKAEMRAMKKDSELLTRIVKSLDDDKAEDIVTIDLEGRSSLADALIIATGRSSRHVASIAEHLARKLKEAGYGTRPIDGATQGDWALVDAGDVIVHIFRPEVRSYYDLEGMWSVDEPAVRAAH
jgi:ribosome-associated protein